MLRKDVKDYISYKVRHYGRGFGYQIRLNGNYVNGITNLKKAAEEGDDVVIEVYRGHGKYTNGYIYNRIDFTVENDRHAIENMRESREEMRKYRQKFRRPRDYQKSKTYKWERRHVDGFKTGDLNIDEAREFVQNIYDTLGFSNTPSVRYHAGRTNTCSYFSYDNSIRVGDWGLDRAVLVHESTHALIDELNLKGRIASHGPLFIRVYINLLDQFLDRDAEELAESARDFGLDVLDEFDIQSWANKVKNNDGKIHEDELKKIRMKDTDDTMNLTEAQEETLDLLYEGNKRNIDGRSARALKNRGLAYKTPDGYYEITNEGKKFVKEDS